MIVTELAATVEVVIDASERVDTVVVVVVVCRACAAAVGAMRFAVGAMLEMSHEAPFMERVFVCAAVAVAAGVTEGVGLASMVSTCVEKREAEPEGF